MLLMCLQQLDLLNNQPQCKSYFLQQCATLHGIHIITDSLIVTLCSCQEDRTLARFVALASPFDFLRCFTPTLFKCNQQQFNDVDTAFLLAASSLITQGVASSQTIDCCKSIHVSTRNTGNEGVTLFAFNRFVIQQIPVNLST